MFFPTDGVSRLYAWLASVGILGRTANCKGLVPQEVRSVQVGEGNRGKK
jgi:hypothetical protein